jgi:lysozyme
MKRLRITAAALSLSALGFASLSAYEHFTSNAVVPIPGDRPTYGLGSTFKEDGSPVKITDTITVPGAIRLSVSHIGKDEAVLRQCVTAPMSQPEWDILVDFSYWFGAYGTCKTDVVKYINQTKYADSCAAYLRYRTAAKKDCSLPENKCRGVWLRAQERNKKCMEAQ